LDVFVRGTDNGLYHTTPAGPAPSGWDKIISGVFKDGPAAVSWGPGRVDVFVHGMDDQVGHVWNA
jgi:hypothetical protein